MLHLYDILEQAKLIYGGKISNYGCHLWCGGGDWLGKNMGKASVTEHSFWDSPLSMLMPVRLCCLCWVVIHCMNIPQIAYQDFWWTLWLLHLVLLWVNYYETSSTDIIMGHLEATHSQPPLLLTRAGWMTSWYPLVSLISFLTHAPFKPWLSSSPLYSRVFSHTIPATWM